MLFVAGSSLFSTEQGISFWCFSIQNEILSYNFGKVPRGVQQYIPPILMVGSAMACFLLLDHRSFRLNRVSRFGAFLFKTRYYPTTSERCRGVSNSIYPLF